MAANWRRGSYRLCLLLSAAASGTIAAFLTAAAQDWHPAPLLVGVAYAAAFAAGFWLLYGVAIWVLVGFGVTAPLAKTTMAAVALLALIAGAAELQSDRLIAQAIETASIERKSAEEAQALALQAEEARIAEFEAERKLNEANAEGELAKKRAVENRTAAAQRKQAADARAAASARRDADIAALLERYPAEAENLAKDQFWRGFRSTDIDAPRRIGSDNDARAHPETGREYLVDCAKSYVRRKCAAALIDAWPEYSKTLNP